MLSSDAANMEPAIRLAEQLNAERGDGGASAAPLGVAILPEDNPSDSGTGPSEPSGAMQPAGR